MGVKGRREKNLGHQGKKRECLEKSQLRGPNSPVSRPLPKVFSISFQSCVIPTARRYINMSTFEESVDTISNKVNKTMSNDELKEIYGLYTQAPVGDINTERPGMLDFTGKAKWDSWKSKEGMSQDEAKEKYIAYAKEMVEKHGLA